MRTVLLIGLGRFGRHVAQKLNDLGHQVMAVDSEEAQVIELAGDVLAEASQANEQN